jgi:hypothetical protein
MSAAILRNIFGNLKFFSIFAPAMRIFSASHHHHRISQG